MNTIMTVAILGLTFLGADTAMRWIFRKTKQLYRRYMANSMEFEPESRQLSATRPWHWNIDRAYESLLEGRSDDARKHLERTYEDLHIARPETKRRAA